MYIQPGAIVDVERRFGIPRAESLSVTMNSREFALLERSRKRGRAHDVTLYILDGNQVAVIRKPSYPTDIFRTPSGGVEEGEDFESGTLREAREETGLEVALQRYVLRIAAAFECGDARVSWTSHVFTALRIDGLLCPIDTHEIAEAKWIPLDELKGAMRQRLQTAGNAGLRYRGELDRLAVEEIERLGLGG